MSQTPVIPKQSEKYDLGSKHGTHSHLATQDNVMHKGDMANGCDIDDQQIDHSTESYTKRIVVTVHH